MTSHLLGGYGSRLVLAAALVLVGCTGTPSDGSHADGSNSDAGPGAPGTPSTTGPLSFSPANLPAGAALAATGDWIFNTDTCTYSKVTIDTAKGTVSCHGQPAGAFTFAAIDQADHSQGTLTAALFVTNKLVIEPGMEVDVIGNRPLIIVALTTATIQGALRASGTGYHANGGGFDGVEGAANGGGPGGGVQAVGLIGAGGGGHCGTGGGTGGGRAYGNATNRPLVGGSGGGGENYATGTGAGGGAIQLSAGTSIEVSGPGSIEVLGAGAGWQMSGGGAGGAILLEAPAVSVFGVLAANGGGGSESGSSRNGANGKASADPAPGGIGNCSTCGNGGDGAAGASVDGQPGTQLDATHVGGGGGGAAGWIRLNSQSGNATIGATAIISPSLATRCATQGTTATN